MGVGVWVWVCMCAVSTVFFHCMEEIPFEIELMCNRVIDCLPGESNNSKTIWRKSDCVTVWHHKKRLQRSCCTSQSLVKYSDFALNCLEGTYESLRITLNCFILYLFCSTVQLFYGFKHNEMKHKGIECSRVKLFHQNGMEQNETYTIYCHILYVLFVCLYNRV